MGSKGLAVTAPGRICQECIDGSRGNALPRSEELNEHQRLRLDGRVEVGGGEVEDIGGKDGVDECQHSGGREQTRDPHCER